MNAIFLDVGSVFVGGVLGALGARHAPDKLKETLPLAFGLANMAMSMGSILRGHSLPAVVAALLLGTIVGTMCRLEHYVRKWGEWMARKLNPGTPPANREKFLELFAVAVIIFCTGATGIYGAMQAAITGNQEILMAKTMLDLFTAAIFASTLGYCVAVLSLPMLASLLFFYGIAGVIMPYATPRMFDDFCSCGGVLLLATGFRMAGIKSFPVIDMTPALLFAMPVSWLFSLV